MTLGGTIISWSSKAQGFTTLLSTEVEYCALSSATQELAFIHNILRELGLYTPPGIIFEDNMGAIYLVRNRQVGCRTKHIDNRHHFMRDLWERDKLKVEYIETDLNEADICTKNLPLTLHSSR